MKDQNSGGKQSLESSSLNSCSKQGHLWRQIRLLKLLSNWVLKSYKSRGCAVAVQPWVLYCPYGKECFPYILSECLSLKFLSTIMSITSSCRPWQVAFMCPPMTTISSTGWASCSPPASADSVSAPSCRHLGVSSWSLGDNWLPQSTGRVAVLIQPGSSWLSLFKVSILAELFPAEMLSLFYSMILEKIISF